MKLNQFFDIRELVPPQIYKIYLSDSIMFLNQNALNMLYRVRVYFNLPIIVNNWHRGGKLKYRGYRPAFTRIGAKNSQHKLGNAFDFNVIGISSDEVNKEIQKHYKVLGVTTLEDKRFSPTWTHIDCRNLGYRTQLKIVKPQVSNKMNLLNKPENIFLE